LRSLVTAAWGASVSRDETATDDGDAMLARSRLEFARSADQTKENRDLEKESAATSPKAPYILYLGSWRKVPRRLSLRRVHPAAAHRARELHVVDSSATH